MKKRLFLIILTGLGTLTLIALSFRKERIANYRFQSARSLSVTNVSKESHQTRRLSLSIAQEVERDIEISHLASKAIELGHYHYARQQINIIEDLPLKIELLRKLAHAYLSVGETQQALLMINQAVELDKHNGSFDAVTWATEWLLTGQEQNVKDIIANLEQTEGQQAQIQLSLAQSYFEAGKIAQGYELVKLIPSDIVLVPDDYPDPRNELLQGIVEKALHQENFDLASQVAVSFPDQVQQVITLRKIAHQYLKRGKSEQGKEKLAQALIKAKSIDAIPVLVDRHTFWSEPNANLFLDLAQDYQELGDKQQALELLDLAIKSIEKFKTQYTFDFVVWNRSKALRQVATRYLEFGEKEKAIATLELATQEAKKFRRKREILIQEFLAIAKIYVNLDKKEQAVLLWQQAFNRLKIIDPKSAELVLETAKVAVLVGQPKEGIELVKTTGSFLMQLEIAVLAGEEQLTKQLAQTKLNQINELPFNNDKIVLLEQVALSLSENKKIALNFLDEIESPFEKAYILVAIAKKYAEENNWNEVNSILNKAVTIAGTIPDKSQQEKWIVETTNRLIKTNEVEEDILEETKANIPLWQLNLAQRLTQRNKSSKLLAEVLFKITERELSDLNDKKALDAFNQLVSILEKSSLKSEFDKQFLHLFKVALNLNKNDFALTVAQQITNKNYKIVALRQVAYNYTLSGNKEKATTILSETMKITQTIENSKIKQEVMEGIAQQQARLELELK